MTPRDGTEMDAAVSVDTIYYFRLAQPNKNKQGARSASKQGARSAPIYALAYITQIYVSYRKHRGTRENNFVYTKRGADIVSSYTSKHNTTWSR